nr:AAA family ATPase [uncultured Lachnoanaerobaculum sp.]
MGQDRFILTITKDEIVSTDKRFTMSNLDSGCNYRPADVYFESENGEKIRRKSNANENNISNLTLPRLVFQIFEENIEKLSESEKKNFPIYRQNNGEWLKGIYSTEEDLKKDTKIEHCGVYESNSGAVFFFYSYFIFSTIIFAKECLQRFGKTGDKFVLEYMEKAEQKKNQIYSDSVVNEIKNPYSKTLLTSKNIIFRGAPGTGKSYLAKQIAADIVSDGATDNYTELTDEQKKQIEFVQFHPSYDYSDFVEGLRPKMNEDGTMGFELYDGIFKSFTDKARRNFESSKKSRKAIEQEASVQTQMKAFFDSIEYGETSFKTVTGNKFTIADIDEEKNRIYIEIPGNKTANKLVLNIGEIRAMLESGLEFNKISDITNFFGKQFATQGYSYDFALFKEIKSKQIKLSDADMNSEKLKNYIFIIDEINRGEISKILGELFFTIDPGYRGPAGSVATQYSNMHVNQAEKFYIPENVYIIGTMNDIDRSVEPIDFAMRRRFRFIEIKVKETQYMLDCLGDNDLKSEAVKKMDSLNEEILKVEDLNENYQIGASYFLKLKELSFDELWEDYIRPLLHEYVHGLYNEEDIMQRFKAAYYV